MSVNSSVELKAYRQEVLNFLQSMTIKFTPVITATNNTVEQNGYAVDQGDQTTWKYYMNLQGKYHPSDTMMTVVSLDTQEVIQFTTSNLAKHIRTGLAYVPGTTYWTDICSRYPTQVDLIKSIVYPVTDVSAAIDAEDFSILGYSTGFLETSELGYILMELEKFLAYVSERWYFTFLSFDPFYVWTYWGSLWYNLAMCIYTARTKAIFTPYVHTWHIWQYLTSQGLSDYSDLLSRKAALFLYRNWNYLKANRGKQTNLTKLDTNLLKPIGVGMYGRAILQEAGTGAADYVLNPTFVATNADASYPDMTNTVPSIAMTEMNARLVNAGNEVHYDSEYISKMQRTLGDTTTNLIPTKLIEIRPIARGRRYADYFNNFVMDNLIYLIANNRYSVDVELEDPVNGTTIPLTMKEVLIVLYYCIKRSGRETDIPNLPTVFTSSTAFSVNPQSIPGIIKRNGIVYPMKNLINLTEFENTLQTTPALITNPTDFSTYVGEQFLAALFLISSHRHNADVMMREACKIVSECVTVKGTYPLNLGVAETTYADWFARRSDLKNGIFDVYDVSDDPIGHYTTLANELLSALIPITSVLARYGNFNISDAGYDRLRQLFVQLISYNVTVLNTARDINQYMTAAMLSAHPEGQNYDRTIGIMKAGGLEIQTTSTNSIEVELHTAQMEPHPEFTSSGTLLMHQKLDLRKKSITVDRTAPIGSSAKPESTTYTNTIRAVVGTAAKLPGMTKVA